MKILYHHRTRADGAEGIHINEIVHAFRELGHEVMVICPRVATTETGLQAAHAKKVHSGRRFRTFLKQSAELAYNAVSYARAMWGIRKFQPAFIYERYTPLNFGGVLAAKNSGVPLILEVNATYAGRLGCDIEMAYRGTASWVERKVFHWADGIVVVSGLLRECVLDRVSDPNKLATTPNAINLGKIRQLDTVRERALVRDRYGITQGFVVGFVGSMRRWHGLDFLAQCIPHILDQHPDTHFLLVGTGEMEPVLRDFVIDNKLSKHVTITGAVRHDEVYSLIAAMDVGLSPDTPPYASPMKLLEYMALGAVPIAPDYPPIREIIESPKTGLIFSPRDTDQFIKSILSLAKDAKMRQILSQAAQTEVIERRSWLNNAMEIISLASRVSKIETTENLRGKSG
jgi:glycosyltransferase involved in cell wall biosynthesis